MSSLAPLSFSCCKNSVSKMSLEQVEELYKEIIECTPEHMRHEFQPTKYRSWPYVCNICEKRSWRRDEPSWLSNEQTYHYCSICRERICVDCIVIARLFHYTCKICHSKQNDNNQADLSFLISEDEK